MDSELVDHIRSDARIEVAIPRVEQLPGQDWCRDDFSKANRSEPIALWQALIPRPTGGEKR
jgi:hypothetical protein